MRPAAIAAGVAIALALGAAPCEAQARPQNYFRNAFHCWIMRVFWSAVNSFMQSSSL